MHIYILGICGTFMGSLAVLAREAGFEVSGCDANVYPPMSTQLEKAGIQLDQGFNVAHLSDEHDLIIVGNAMSRGNVMVEHMLNRSLPYTSGPQFLHDHLLQDKWVLAVAGTHGKTSTSSMLAFILDYAGLKPGFLIGGVVQDFEFSARLGDSIFFVVEADEYDTAFFDKRSKFVHYLPKTLVLNNLEFDHADIFENLAAIEKQFHHVVRIVPSLGRVICNADDENLTRVLDKGVWSEQASFSVKGVGGFNVQMLEPDGSCLRVANPSGQTQDLSWNLTGEHNAYNALAAIAAAEHVGVSLTESVEALSQYKGVKRRMELIGEIDGIKIYDDFAHHPTAIATTLAGAKASIEKSNTGRIIAVIEPRSNTMKMGIHQQALIESVKDADLAYWFMGEQNWGLSDKAGLLYQDFNALIEAVATSANAGDKIVIMSNGGFSGFHQKLLTRLSDQVLASEQGA